ncbi:MAG: archaellin/type IV pilin N-terminal domain-containing protein, partial [Candidatus Heimdallarchaeota archaeon]
MTNDYNKIKFTWKGRAITSARIIKKVWRSKRAVSPIIAVVLLIALTVAAAAVVWTLTSGIIDNSNVELVLEAYGVADTDGDKEGDLIELQIRNIGIDDAKITEVKIFRDNSQQATWTMGATSYDVSTIGLVRIQTIDSSQQVTNLDEVRVEVKDSVAGALLTAKIKIPNTLSSIPVFFNGGDFSNIDINANGWTEYTYNTHGGGAGISVVGNDLVFATNDDILFYLQNTTFQVQNGIITAQFLWGDNDGIGIAFRIVNQFNYYWVGYT